ncbi:hypothetical protein DNTS_014059, partial [Danionella cerebrum]
TTVNPQCLRKQLESGHVVFPKASRARGRGCIPAAPEWLPYIAMIAAAFLVLLRPLSVQYLLFLLVLLIATIATIVFLCCFHRKLRNDKIPIKSVLPRRSRSREAGFRTHCFRSEVCRHSPRHVRRSVRARVPEEKPLIESEPDSSACPRKRRVRRRVPQEFYHSVQLTPTRKPRRVSYRRILRASVCASGVRGVCCFLPGPSLSFTPIYAPDPRGIAPFRGCGSSAPKNDFTGCQCALLLESTRERGREGERDMHTASSGSGNASLRCSMSSSADFSDDEEYSAKSGSVSPAPGDTLPWNLPRHERSKRKIQGGSVLDPAERAVLRIAADEQEYLQAYEEVLEKYKDERDRVQKKTFTKWINQHLLKVRKHVNDLYEDLRDGHKLISLLEVLSGEALLEQHGRDEDEEEDEDKGPREKGRMRFHRLQNVQIALDYLKRRQVKLVNIRNDDITDGNPKLTLGLIWTIILHFQVPVLRGNKSGDTKVRLSAESILHGVSRSTALKDVSLKSTALRRALSFEAVEHTLQTLRSSEEQRLESMEGWSQIIWDTPVHRKRRRAQTCSEGLVSQTCLDESQRDPQRASAGNPEISEIHVTGESEDMTAKEKLLLWSQQTTEGYSGLHCHNFTSSWRDGRLFNAILHKYRPDLVDMSRVSAQSSRSNLEQAFGVAERLGTWMCPHRMRNQSLLTYQHYTTSSQKYRKEQRASDVDVKWVEYQNMVKYLSQWIKHHVSLMSERNFPSNPAELKMWIEFGRVQLPADLHPNDVEKAWGELIVAMLERQKSLKPEIDSALRNARGCSREDGCTLSGSVRMMNSELIYRGSTSSMSGSTLTSRGSAENLPWPSSEPLSSTPLTLNNSSAYGLRLEMLQQIANRVQRDCVAGEDKLALARSSLQSDTKRLESGLQCQQEAEIAGFLLDCDNLLRQQVVDIQILLDGKFYLADQLVQRVSKLRDDLLALRSEFSSVYNKGRALTSEQTKMMISGITHSLNQSFTSSFSPNLSPRGPALTALTPSMPRGHVQTYLSPRAGESLELKHVQIRKPMLKTSMEDSSLSQDELNLKFVQDLINWVEEMQAQLDQADWGSDLPSVESNLGNHKDFHKAIEDFQMSVKEVKMSEMQMSSALKPSFSEKLSRLETQYGRLLKSSGERQRLLDSLFDFVSRATLELIWLNEKEEEEVAFDWSERNCSVSRKKDYHADLMRELEEKEEAIRSVQEKAEGLLLENHPARLTIEAYRAAMQTQWSWILQLCHCVEHHLKDNAAYFQFFSDAREALEYLKSLQDSIQRKYSCERSSSSVRLEQLIQDSMEEKEQLLKYSSSVGLLVARAKTVVQLKPRNPENPVRSSIPIKAICDYRQIEITISKEDECVLVSNSHRAKWKVISPSGNEAMVPSVCFSVPPPNKEATEMASRMEQLYQNVLTLWHHSHVNMKSVVSWHYLKNDMRSIRKSTVASIKTLLPGDHEQVLSSLQCHFEDFLRDSEESEVFTVADCAQLEKDVVACREYYEELLKSAEREEHEESANNLFLSEVRNLRVQVEAHEEHLIRKIRTPLDRDDLQESVRRIAESEKKKEDLEHLKEDLELLREKCEVFLRQASGSPSASTLSSELSVLSQSFGQVFSMCCIYLEKLKTVSLVLKHGQSAEALVKLYEAKLSEEDSISASIKSIDAVTSTLKQWRSEIDEKREVFHDLEDELQKARLVSERMFKAHNERDFDLDWHKEKAEQLKERWQGIHSQIENRLRDLEGISKSLKYYTETFSGLNEWSKEMEMKQRKAQENQPEDSKALAEFLNQQKVLVSEIEQMQGKIEECQKYSEQYTAGVKEYELQLMTYRAMVDSQHKSPLKRRKMQSSPDAMQQEFMDLRTRYTALVTLMTQYVKFAGETLKRAEEDEISVEEMLTAKGDTSRSTELMLGKHSDKMTEKERDEVKELQSPQEADGEVSPQSANVTSSDQAAAEKQKEFSEKLQELCEDLDQTEKRLSGNQQQAVRANTVADLQQSQQEQQALQKDLQANASALSEVISSTQKFLEENRSKLSPEQTSALERTLEELKNKANTLNQRAEESRKDLEKILTSAIRQENEKVAAVEQLEESKSRIEGLLGWISNIGKEKEMDGEQKERRAGENGNLLENSLMKRRIEDEENDPNGNAPDATDLTRTLGDEMEDADAPDLEQQYHRAHHQEILSQQQDLIIATQSAQALLDKQSPNLSPAEKAQLQRDVTELRGRYETTLSQAEQQMKQLQTVQEELQKFSHESDTFETWLQEAHGQMEDLRTPAASLDALRNQLQRQKSFSEDVISHRGDLRFVSISGQKVLDAAEVCASGGDGLPATDMSGTCAAVRERLDSAAARYKTLHTECNQLGQKLRDVVENLRRFDGTRGALSLQAQTTSHQATLETLRRAAETLLSSDRELLSNPEHVQESTDELVERYESLSKTVGERQEKLQVTLTRSLSVQDGLDEMMSWMERVEEKVKRRPAVMLSSCAVTEVLSKEVALEQEMLSRQSSVSAVRSKLEQFVESADPAAAALLQKQMESLSRSFTDALELQRRKVLQLEELRSKLEEFEKSSEKMQEFVNRSSQADVETPGKNMKELSQLLQDSQAELLEKEKDLEALHKLSVELTRHAPEGSGAPVLNKMKNISDGFSALKQMLTERASEVWSCQNQLQEFRAAAGGMMKWLKETRECAAGLRLEPGEHALRTELQKTNDLLAEWTSRSAAVQDVSRRGSAVCRLIRALASPAQTKRRHSSGLVLSNGSDTGNHIDLTNQELKLVEQDVSSLNKDYEDLGLILRSRLSEIGDSLKNVQAAREETEGLLEWMEEAQKKAASSGNRAVKSQLEQQKVFEESLKEKQQQLQTLREKLLKLIEEHPDSPDAELWRSKLAQIDAGWEQLRGSVEIQKQHLEESSRKLELLQTSGPQLEQWLEEKERMLGVLGPLSAQPHMLITQKQQVQILLQEFDSRKPQFEELKEVVASALSSSEKQDPAAAQMKQQLAAITLKWQDLTSQLSERHALIQQGVEKSTQFQNLLQSLSKSATCLETELNNQQPLSSQPEEVQRQIQATSSILTQLRGEKKRLQEADSICSELLKIVTEEYLRADLTKQLETINKPFRHLEDKTADGAAQLAFASSQQFHQTSKDFQTWLNQTLQEQSSPKPISAHVEMLKQSLQEISAVQKAIRDHEDPYQTIIKEGDALLQSTEGAEKVALQGQLSALRSNWEDVKRSSSERAEKLKEAKLKAEKYQEHAENLSSWLKESEDRERAVKLSTNLMEIEEALSELKAIQKDVDKHGGQVVMMNSCADSLLEIITRDGDAVREEKLSIGKRVDKLSEDVTSRRESLQCISQKLKEFNDLKKEAKGQLESAQKHLDSVSCLGVQAYTSKNLTSMKAQQNNLETLHNQIEHLKNSAQTLVADASEAEGVTDLLLEADGLEKDHSWLSRKIQDVCSTLESKLQGIGQFQNSIREMFANFADMDDDLDGMPPVGRDLVTLREQQAGIQNFVEKLQDLINSTVDAKDNCKRMLDSEASPDLLGLKRDLETLGKQCGKLMDRATGRREQVEETLHHLKDFYCKTKEFNLKLDSAEQQEESQGSVGLETEVINQQLESFKLYQKDVVESLQSQLQELNSLGQALIQNAPKGTSTGNLDRDLEVVNTRWNTLNKKVTDRSAQLHEALLRCGRFQDALESLLSWLTDTEELVANQKPPSAEFKVVKAQIQEQKLLQRLLDERRPTVELIQSEGRRLTDVSGCVEKQKIGREVESLAQRWSALLRKAESRHKQLQNILGVAQQFHETFEPLSEWLTATEKKLANSEPIGTQTPKLQEQISQHKSLEEEVQGRGKLLHQAMSMGQSLRTLSSVEDRDLVQTKLDLTHRVYLELQEACEKRAELLRQALANARIFGEDEVALMTWLDEVHGKLSEVTVPDYAASALHKRHAEQLALHEDIERRRQSVDQAVLNGLELLKHTTGEEVVLVQGKLDEIKQRYSEIRVLSAGVSHTLERALSLALKLKNSQQEMNDWMEALERELESFDAPQTLAEQLSHSRQRLAALVEDLRSRKPLLDSVNEAGSALLELVPWRARENLDRILSDTNQRYQTASDTLTQRLEHTVSAIQKSLQWLTEAEQKLLGLGDILLEPEQASAQLQVQKSFSMDIMRHKDAVDEIVMTAEAISSGKDEAEKQKLRLNSERCLQLDRAQSLSAQFWETHEELWPWLQETRTSFSQLSQPAIEHEALREQQEELRQMRELIAEHKPHIDKMNKTGPQLVELSPAQGAFIREKQEEAELLYTQLRADVKIRAATIDEAISKSTQFHDKMSPLLESLERCAERLRRPLSVSVELEKIREQIGENKTMSVELEKLQPAYEMLRRGGEEMIQRSLLADTHLSAKAVQEKLDQMVFLWSDIQALLEEREAKLLDVLELAEKFWCDHCALVVTIRDTQELLKELEEPGVDPSVVKQQQEALEGFREEIDGLQDELNVVQNLGAELMTACGEPDKPVIKKSVDEVNSAWETLNKAWKERVETLEEAMQAAVLFQDSLQNMFDSVDIMEAKLDSMSAVGTDLETVKQQMEELKEFKSEAYQLQIEMERLNHQAGLLLKKVLDEEQRSDILEPIGELKMLWENLDHKIISRQHKLEGALLALGQFQHALDELLSWLSHTEDLLSEQRETCGDPKAIEIQLAKHHVLQNDVLAHKSTVEAVNKAGGELIDSSAGEEARSLQVKLENLNQRWRSLLGKTEQRRKLLDSALLQAQGFHGEIEDLQQWLKDTERQLLSSKPLGGLPDTAREQLDTHLELCSALEVKEEIFQELLQRGQQILVLNPEAQDSSTEGDLRNLQEKWTSVQTKAGERKVKLEEALAMASDFHNSLQDFINWLTQAEQTLNVSSPASLILENISFQIDEHKVFVTEVNSHRDQIMNLDKTGTHLKYFAQKQDVVLIKNLLLSVQSRWEKLLQRSLERGRLLDEAKKRAKQFHESWSKLMEWLQESERALDTEMEIANDPDKIKLQLSQHKEFQRALGSKHAVYDSTGRTGRALKDRSALQDDTQKLEHMLSQFTDALQALIDWLYKVEPQLAEDQPVHGDIDLVLNLIHSHKVFQKELGKRTVSVQALKRSARELTESSHHDSSWVKAQMQELSARWESVCSLSVSKQSRLQQALAQSFTPAFTSCWSGWPKPNRVFASTELFLTTKMPSEFLKKLEEQRLALGKASSMGENILSICHPDSNTTIKHWITIIKARFEEVTAWARQHQQRLSTALDELLANQELLENLLTWLQWAERTLGEKDKESLPLEIEEVKALIAEHQTFMEEMTRKQPDVDKVTKTHKRKAPADSALQSQIPVPERGRASRKRSPTQSLYAAASQAQTESKNPRVKLLVSKWQQVWLLALDRRRKLNDALDRLEELKEFANFDFDVWRKRYMRWMNHKKSRVMDFFRRIDKDQDGKVTRQEFIEGILSSKFPTSRLEMSAVADIFDRDGDGYIDYYEFVAALHPNKEAYKPLTDADKIEDEVTRQVAKCKCPKRFQVEQIGANKYRFGLVHCLHDSLIADETIANRDSQNLTPHLQVAVLESCILFGDSQQLRLVRILRSTVMVRVGGGWMALDEFLVKNDPCRVHHHGSKMLRSESNSSITQSPIAKGRTNVELREKFILPEGTTQVMASFRYRGRRSRPSSRGASPNRSNTSQSCTPQPNHPGTGTPKSTPIQGSKLRLPGYLSGKGFQTVEDGALINAAVMKARAQALGSSRIPSRPGSKPGSRGSSRRGSDASDFDISDIQSVCSDAATDPTICVSPTQRETLQNPNSTAEEHAYEQTGQEQQEIVAASSANRTSILEMASQLHEICLEWERGSGGSWLLDRQTRSKDWKDSVNYSVVKMTCGVCVCVCVCVCVSAERNGVV